MKIAIVTLPHPPIGDDERQGAMIDEAALNTLGGAEAAADQEVVVAMFPDGSHRIVKDRHGDTELTVIPR